MNEKLKFEELAIKIFIACIPHCGSGPAAIKSAIETADALLKTIKEKANSL